MSVATQRAPDPDFRPRDAGGDGRLVCTMCGCDFTISEAMAGHEGGPCASCQGCARVKCPNCGMPRYDESRTLSVFARLFGRKEVVR